MKKTGFISITSGGLISPIMGMGLKRYMLFFDKILIDYKLLDMAVEVAYRYLREYDFPWTSVTLEMGEIFKDNLNYNLQVIDALEKHGMLEAVNADSQISEIECTNARDSLIVADLRKIKKDIYNDYQEFRYEMDGETQLDKARDLTLDKWFNVDATTRLYCLSKNLSKDCEIIPMYLEDDVLNNDSVADKNYITKIVLNNIPVPSVDVSFEQLLDFKNDIDTKAKYYSLINWINDSARKQLTVAEFEDAFCDLYYNYLNHLKTYKIKHSSSVIEIVVNGLAETLENVARLKFSAITKGFFSLFKNQVTLLEDEQNIVGRELGYLYKAQHIF